jgi:hypothetical protein
MDLNLRGKGVYGRAGEEAGVGLSTAHLILSQQLMLREQNILALIR